MGHEIFDSRELVELEKVFAAVAARVAEARRIATRAVEAQTALNAAELAFRADPTAQTSAGVLEASTACVRASTLANVIGDVRDFEADALRAATDGNAGAWALLVKAAERKQTAIESAARDARVKVAEIEAAMTTDAIPLDPALRPREYTAHSIAKTRAMQLGDQAQQLATAVAQIRQRIAWLQSDQSGPRPSGADTPFSAFLAIVRAPIASSNTASHD